MKPYILVVDDNPEFLELISMRIESAGFNVCTALSPEDALHQCLANPPSVIVSDLRMEPISGIQFFENLKSERFNIPFILLTAHGSIPDAVKATRDGVFSFLTKPIDSTQLIQTISRAFEMMEGSSIPKKKKSTSLQEFVTQSPQMQRTLIHAKKAAKSNTNILLTGESGSGKELLARYIHHNSPRFEKNFVAINCSAIPENLLEAELFGYSKGSFTGANRDFEGLFRSAGHGTIFLDEIGDMPANLQVKLLRVLQDRIVRPIGSTTEFPIHARVISATHQDLKKAQESGSFRSDLYYRLRVIAITIPPLRDRKEDIPLIVDQFLSELDQNLNIAPEALHRLVSYKWPGNVRQLINVLEQVSALCSGAFINSEDVDLALEDEDAPPNYPSLKEAKDRFERDYLLRVLKLTQGNAGKAARVADRNRTDFYKLIKRHSINLDSFKPQKLGKQ